jgi:diguanylate cyclase (GGDEF) domain
MSKYKADQSLNTWVTMLQEIYGVSQNYAKSPNEVHVHLTEVTGGLGRFLIKKKDLGSAIRFAAKTFAWTIALLVKVKPQDINIEDILLRKFPGVCPYCHYAPCQCWRGTKPDLDEQRIRNAFFTFAGVARRTPNDFQLMFRRIYSESWENQAEVVPIIITRLFEELAEIAEAIRFFHLYPTNFDNELADFLAWWFALISTMHQIAPQANPLLVEDLLWQSYPGYCLDCQLRPCFCRPGPVRELISKPVPGDLERLDRLTLLFNQAALLEDQQGVAKGTQPANFPLATVRIDLDDFKKVNDQFGHAAGDEALRHLAAILRLKARERDRVYRAGGDEFVILCSDTSKEEAFGTMRRVAEDLRRKPVRWVNEAGVSTEFPITISVGVAECGQADELNATLEIADKAAYESKANGKNQITMAA